MSSPLLKYFLKVFMLNYENNCKHTGILVGHGKNYALIFFKSLKKVWKMFFTARNFTGTESYITTSQCSKCQSQRNQSEPSSQSNGRRKGSGGHQWWRHRWRQSRGRTERGSAEKSLSQNFFRFGKKNSQIIIEMIVHSL